MGYAVVIAGASGSGKSTVANMLVSAYPHKYSLSRSATTRPKREDDFGKDEYIFCSKEQFLAKIEAGDMIESTEYSGNMYGTPKSELERIINEGRCPVLVLDINGVKAFYKSEIPYRVYIFYLYEHINVIEQRLYDRYLKNNKSLNAFLSFQKRKQANIMDYMAASDYIGLFDAYIENSELDKCLCSLEYCLRKFEGEVSSDMPKGVAISTEEKKSLAESLSEQARVKV